MDKPLISIIVPVYNMEQYLDVCIRSVIAQTYTNFELILVDDNSLDSSFSICRNWQNKDKRVISYTKKNEGVIKAREYGVFRSKGEYISFLDSDDYIESDYLSCLIETLEKYDADFSMGMHRRFRDDDLDNFTVRKSTSLGKEWKNYRKAYNIKKEIESFCINKEAFIDSLFKINTQINVQYVWGKLYKRNLILNNLLDTNISIAEDSATIFSIALDSSKIAIFDSVIYNYRINKNSLTESAFSDKNFGLLTAWDLIIDIGKRKGASFDIIDKASFNRKRADFGILVNIAMDRSFDRLKFTYKDEIKKILKDLKKNRNILLRGKIPLSRKVIIILFSISYDIFGKLINLIFMLK